MQCGRAAASAVRFRGDSQNISRTKFGEEPQFCEIAAMGKVKTFAQQIAELGDPVPQGIYLLLSFCCMAKSNSLQTSIQKKMVLCRIATMIVDQGRVTMG